MLKLFPQIDDIELKTGCQLFSIRLSLCHIDA